MDAQLKTMFSVFENYIECTKLNYDDHEDYLSIGEAIDCIILDIEKNIHLFKGYNEYVLKKIVKIVHNEELTDDECFDEIVDFINYTKERADDDDI